MDLPILRTDATASPAALLRTAKKALADLAACTVDPEPVAGCTAFSAPDRPNVAGVNAIYDLHLAEGRSAAEVLGEVEAHYAPKGGAGGGGGRGGCRRLVMSAGESFEPELREALLAEGWRETAAELLVMRSLRLASERESNVQVLPARAVLGQYEAFARELAVSRNEESGALWLASDDAEGAASCWVEQLDETRLDVLLGRRDRRAVAVASVMSLGDVGVLQHVDRLDVKDGEAVLRRALTELFELCSRAQFKTLCALVTADEGRKRETLTSLGMVKVAETPLLLRDES